MINFYSMSGIVTAINNFYSNGIETTGCIKWVTITGRDGSIVNFVVSPDTYFVDQKVISTGDLITGYFDGNAPVPLIYPPQYNAIIIVKYDSNQNVKVSFFNDQLLSSDGQLKLNIAPFTQIMLKNGQPFTENPANRNLIVIYGPSTRSIPAQTTPTQIIVWC